MRNARRMSWARIGSVWVGWALCCGAAAALDKAPAPASEAHPRALGLNGAPNFRDIGGYAASDGRHVRWGRVFRSSELSKLTPEDEKKVAALDIAAVVDLRTDEERNRSPSAWLTWPGDIYVSPKTSLAPVMTMITKDAATPDGARAGMESLYAQMPDMYRDEYSALMHRIASGELPILVHCSAGKDRTGVAIAVLLATLKVPRETIVSDYALTEKLAPALSAASLGGMPPESQRMLWRSDPDYVEVALRSIDREYGSVEGYVHDGLHVSAQEEAAIRKSLME